MMMFKVRKKKNIRGAIRKVFGICLFSVVIFVIGYGIQVGIQENAYVLIAIIVIGIFIFLFFPLGSRQ